MAVVSLSSIHIRSLAFLLHVEDNFHTHIILSTSKFKKKLIFKAAVSKIKSCLKFSIQNICRTKIIGCTVSSLCIVSRLCHYKAHKTAVQSPHRSFLIHTGTLASCRAAIPSLSK